jgi:hypothetical protein
MTIDALAYARKLEAAGVRRAEAEVHAQALRNMIDGQLLKRDLDNAVRHVELGDHGLEISFQRLQGTLDLLICMVGFNLAATMVILCKLAL